MLGMTSCDDPASDSRGSSAVRREGEVVEGTIIAAEEDVRLAGRVRGAPGEPGKKGGFGSGLVSKQARALSVFQSPQQELGKRAPARLVLSRKKW